MHELLVKRRFEDEIGSLTPRFLSNRCWLLNEVDYPIIDLTFCGSRPLRLRLTCDNWDEQPPSAILLDESGGPLSGSIPGGIFNPGPHPLRPGPFICMRGFREYHTHPSHLTVDWASFRDQDGMNLVGLLDQVSRAWRALCGY